MTSTIIIMIISHILTLITGVAVGIIVAIFTSRNTRRKRLNSILFEIKTVAREMSSETNIVRQLEILNSRLIECKTELYRHSPMDRNTTLHWIKAINYLDECGNKLTVVNKSELVNQYTHTLINEIVVNSSEYLSEEYSHE